MNADERRAPEDDLIERGIDFIPCTPVKRVLLGHTDGTGRTEDGQVVSADQIADQMFLPVRGHSDDDECTFRPDGTDATYCALPESAHEWSLR